jgi:hypothetical protein
MEEIQHEYYFGNCFKSSKYRLKLLTNSEMASFSIEMDPDTFQDD